MEELRENAPGSNRVPAQERVTKDAFREYLCEKIDQLLVMMGSRPLDSSQLQDGELLDLDPIGTISESFGQMLANLHNVNDRLRSEIDDRKRAEDALREKEERFRTLAEFSSDWVFWRGPDGAVLYVSPACEPISGYAPREFCGSAGLFSSIVHPEDRESWENHSCAVEKSRRQGQIELRIVTREGETRWISHVCRPVFNDTGQFLGIRGSNSNITDRKRSEQALQESEERLRDFFDNAMDLIQSVSTDGRFLYVNRAWKEALGYTDEEIRRLKVFDIIVPECMDHCSEMFRRIMAGENTGNLETTFRAKDGRRIVVEGHVNCRIEDGKPVASRGIFRDVTEKKRMEEEFRKANTLESIGILAGGIAHDFNNILTAIMGYISLAKMEVDTGGRIWERLAEAEKASVRAQDLTRQLLTFSKGGAPILQSAPIGELVEEAAVFSLRGSNVKCRFAIDPDLSPVDIDPVQIGQVINNIVLNASQAMPEGGIVRVEARNVSVPPEAGPTLPVGRYVKIRIEDTGPGIPGENIPKIFNPFFTTKELGTGLGLATAYSIMKRHHGQIFVESRMGEGTTFSLFLPVSKRIAPQCSETDAPSALEGGRVLVMDDEEMVRKVALTILESLGYRGYGVKDGSEAIDSYVEAMKAGTPFEAVILDLTVPGGMGGKETVGKLLQADPGARVIVSSGYSHDPVMSEYGKYGFRGVIAKPYQIGEFQKTLRALFQEPREPVGRTPSFS